jgi:hypothetical protein
MADVGSDPLATLKTTLDAAQKNTSQMLSKLQHLESRLKCIDEVMIPIQEVTEREL